MNAHTLTRQDNGPDAVDIHAGMRMREIRKARGLSQQDLAAAVGISFQQVQKYERGSNRLSLSRAYHISKILGVTVADFYTGLSEEWEQGVLPASVMSWALTARGQQWGAVGERLPPEDFHTVLRVVEMIGRGRG